MLEDRLALLCALVAIVLQGSHHSRFRDHAILLAIGGILLLLYKQEQRMLQQQHRRPARRPRRRVTKEGFDGDQEEAPVVAEPVETPLEVNTDDPHNPYMQEEDDFGTYIIEDSVGAPRWGPYAEKLRARPHACPQREGPPVWHKRDRLARVAPYGTAQAMYRDTTGQTSRFSHLR